MKKDKLEKALINYSGVATALLGATAAQGQVIINDIPDTTLSTNGAVYAFDINQDIDTSNYIDFRIRLFVDSGLYRYTGVTIETNNVAGNQVLGMDYANYNYPFKLGFNDTVGTAGPWKGLGSSNVAGKLLGYMALSINDTTYPNSQFVGGVTDGFLGLKFQGDFNDTIRTYYGWIRLDVAADLKSVTIKEHAFNSDYGQPVYAGNLWVGAEELAARTPELVQRGKYLDVTFPDELQSAATLQFFDLGGKLIREEELTAANSRIELENLPKGMVVAAVNNGQVSASKKVVIY
ncbi:hypothetical protein Oweho_1266 [Owenweeksia hongkongensis DSM 17368]|uniref:Secretion system C-terminal sorting domain-containing protein n=1 Tax=Owenweeksia hongkongensis (strain DSM 17368 / CIP 108786 / JCM 12287 / NRRL B-23963 / UST20020801) TaxID=926562 RepID=G8R6T1_OWEHD|nr:hypothetical protein [Owenweeksia hongkongensis]AEV32266.1 hypothetical protein Oweho_1266 [Owenweeksia hongkongensis DSM 17368]